MSTDKLEIKNVTALTLYKDPEQDDVCEFKGCRETATTRFEVGPVGSAPGTEISVCPFHAEDETAKSIYREFWKWGY